MLTALWQNVFDHLPMVGLLKGDKIAYVFFFHRLGVN